MLLTYCIFFVVLVNIEPCFLHIVSFSLFLCILSHASYIFVSFTLFLLILSHASYIFVSFSLFL